ncbi:MAG: J domain-containing protein [Dehalococcoidia bacterium]
MSDRDYYEILGLTPGADGAMVDQAYWHLARKYQSLAVTDDRARILLDELNEAYGVLGTPRLREQYDAYRDEVLIPSGVIQPVRAKQPQPRPQAQTRHEGPDAEPPSVGPSWSLPVPQLQHGRTYIVSGIIAALAFAAAWQGVNIMFVLGALAAGLALSLFPTLRGLPEMRISMPSVPDVHTPQLAVSRLANLGMGRIRELGLAGEEDSDLDPDALRSSTAGMIARWRHSVGLRNISRDMLPGAGIPSARLMEIVETERELGDEDEPLAAVLDILRGSRTQAAESTPHS